MRTRGRQIKGVLQGLDDKVLFPYVCFVHVHTCCVPGNVPKMQRKDTVLVLEQLTAVRGRHRAGPQMTEPRRRLEGSGGGGQCPGDGGPSLIYLEGEGADIWGEEPQYKGREAGKSLGLPKSYI